jgi:tetratricopeptide (TPR) repeat protein
LAWKIWKDAISRFEAEYNEAVNERNKGNIEGAIKHFQSAAKIASESKDQSLIERGKLAIAMAIIYMVIREPSAQSLEDAKNFLQYLDPNIELDLALPYKIRTGDLLRELEVLIRVYSIPQVNLEEVRSLPSEEVEKLAIEYESVAMQALSYGREKYLLESLLKLDEPQKMGFKFLALSRIVKGLRIEEEDPDKAVQLHSEAIGYLANVPGQQYSELVNDRLSKLSKATKCWLCGRNIQGEGVHFVYLPSIITPYILNCYNNDAPQIIVSSEDEAYVAVCSPCYGAIYKLSIKVAKRYYDLAMTELRRVERELWAAIHALEHKIGYKGRIEV